MYLSKLREKIITIKTAIGQMVTDEVLDSEEASTVALLLFEQVIKNDTLEV